MKKNSFKSKYLHNNYNLPEFVKKSPHYQSHFKQEIEIVRNFDGKWGIRYEHGQLATSYDYETFFEAYYDNCTYYDCIWFSNEIAQIIFGKSGFKDKDEDNSNSERNTSNIGDIFFGKKTDNGNYRMISRKRGDHIIKGLVDDYEEWQKKDEALQINSFTVENIAEIFEWLNTHVYFWLEKKIGDTYSWSTEDGVSSLYTKPMKVDPQTRKVIDEYALGYQTKPFATEWWIEGGLHVINEEDEDRYCVEHYHDIALDERGATYDEAFINFARNVWLQARGELKEKEEKRDNILDRIFNDESA